jgi:hypothetical protein
MAHLEFSYLVNGAKFFGRKIRSEIGKRSSTYLKLYSYIQNYPVGTQIQIFYDPSNPQLAELGINPRATHGMLFFSLLMLTMSSLVGYFLFNHLISGIPLS